MFKTRQSPAQSVVEFAIILPLLTLIVIVAIGVAGWFYSAASNSSRLKFLDTTSMQLANIPTGAAAQLPSMLNGYSNGMQLPGERPATMSLSGIDTSNVVAFIQITQPIGRLLPGLPITKSSAVEVRKSALLQDNRGTFISEAALPAGQNTQAYTSSPGITGVVNPADFGIDPAKIPINVRLQNPSCAPSTVVITPAVAPAITVPNTAPMINNFAPWASLPASPYQIQGYSAPTDTLVSPYTTDYADGLVIMDSELQNTDTAVSPLSQAATPCFSAASQTAWTTACTTEQALLAAGGIPGSLIPGTGTPGNEQRLGGGDPASPTFVSECVLKKQAACNAQLVNRYMTAVVGAMAQAQGCNQTFYPPGSIRFLSSGSYQYGN